MKDIVGRDLSVGDYIVYGENNGSTLYVGKIFKLGNKKCWFHHVFIEDGVYETAEHIVCNRDYTHVTLLNK